MNFPKFIAVEGLDGTGKSTIAKTLASRIGYEYMKTPSGAFQNARANFDSPDISSIERMAFYTGDCLKLSVEVKTGVRSAIIVDRYYYSTLAYHKEQAPELISQFEPICQQLEKPDVVILLHTDFEISKKRILSRSIDPSYEDKFLNQEAFQRIYENYLYFIETPLLIIENSGTIDEVMDEILNRLQSISF